MTAKQKFEQFLQQHQINYVLPENILDDESIYQSIHAVCERLVAARPVLLNAGDLKNLHRLIMIAQDALFFTGTYNPQFESQRPLHFQNAINLLCEANPPVLNQDSFDAICCITLANLDQWDILHTAECLVSMSKLNLLTKKNIQNLVERILNAPLRTLVAQQAMTNGTDEAAPPPLHDTSCAEKLKNWLHQGSWRKTDDSWLNQDNFDLMMQSKREVSRIHFYMEKLDDKGLNTAANCQALIDAQLPFNSLSPELPANTQEEFNTYLLGICDKKLRRLEIDIGSISGKSDNVDKTNAARAAILHASRLSQKLSELRYTAEVKADPRDFLHTLAIVRKALPTTAHRPDKTDIEELIALGERSEGHPSTLWQNVGKIMMVLGAALAITAGIILGIGSAGIASIGIGIATVGTISALSGLGIFSYARSRNGLSENIIDLAEATALCSG